MLRLRTSAWRVAQKDSILPFVQGVSILVRMCRISSSVSVRWKRLSIVRTIVTNGVPLSVISSCGMPHSSIASARVSRTGSASFVATARIPSRYRLKSSTRATK
jgi:hypothetical protein